MKCSGSLGVKKSALSGMKSCIEFYTDQERDASTGLYNYDARLYDPVIGRFVNADSIVPNWYYPQSLNKYSYCYNNPLIFIDPDGHAPYRKYVLLAFGADQNTANVWRNKLGNPPIGQNVTSWKKMAEVLTKGESKLEVLAMQAHGSGEESGILFMFNPQNRGLDQFTYESAMKSENKKYAEAIVKEFHSKGIIILGSCFAGKNPSEMKKLANFFKVKIWGYTGKLGAGLIPLSEGEWVQISPDQERNEKNDRGEYYDDERVEDRIKRILYAFGIVPSGKK